MAIDINIPSPIKNYANLAAFPATGTLKTIFIAEDTNKTYRWTGSIYVEISASQAAAWGTITGTLSTQTDLQNALNAKVTGNTAITGATKTKVTYDSKGLVTSGADATTADIADSLNKRYVTDANLTTIANQSGVNTGDQTLAGLSGVPTTRTLTINGTTQDLSADRTFTVSTGITIGTTAITSGTVGRVMFQGTGNVVQQSANLFWDNVNGFFGVNAPAPTVALDVVTNSIGSPFQLRNLNTTGVVAVNLFNAGGTNVGGFGYAGSTYSGTALQDKLYFFTPKDFIITPNGTTNYFRVFTASGNVGINTTTDAGFKTDINGTLRVKGTGTTSATTAFTVQNSSNFLSLIVRDDNVVQGYDTANNVRFQLGNVTNGQGISTRNGNFAVGFIDAGQLASMRFLMTGSGSGYIDGYSEGTAKVLNYPLFIGSRVNNNGTAVANTTTQENGTQVFFGSAIADNSAQVGINSTTRGFLPPRMTTTQKNAIATPSAGLMVYDTTLNLISVYNGTIWISL